MTSLPRPEFNIENKDDHEVSGAEGEVQPAAKVNGEERALGNGYDTKRINFRLREDQERLFVAWSTEVSWRGNLAEFIQLALDRLFSMEGFELVFGNSLLYGDTTPDTRVYSRRHSFNLTTRLTYDHN